MVIGVDFDHTLVERDTPLPGAKEAMHALKDAGHTILIHSCNNPEWIRLVLSNNDIPYDGVWEGHGKPVCDWYVDDRAAHFNGDWPSMLWLMGVKNEY